jgi:hypothetical protein
VVFHILDDAKDHALCGCRIALLDLDAQRREIMIAGDQTGVIRA